VTSPAGRQPGPDDGGTLPPPGGPPPTRVDPAVGADGAPARFGPYRVVRELARGGMGVVLVAVHEQLGRRVALKILQPGLPETARARFLTEAQAAARLRHPNVVAIHEVGEAGGRPYLAMDLIEGESLKDRLERAGPLEPREAARIVATVARAVYAAHRESVLHRDIKPHNVLLDAQGAPYLTDFGLAKDVSRAEDGLTTEGEAMGTPAYMPPEQAEGRLDKVDRRSDVYSLGATLYEALTGEPPFGGGSSLNVVVAVLSKDPTPPGKRRPGLDRDLETICLKCLEKARLARYDSAEELALDLERYLADEPIAARPVGPLERLVRRARRNRAVGRVVAVAAVAVVAALAWALVGWSRARTARGEAEAQEAIAREARAAAERDRDRLAAERDRLAARERLGRGYAFLASGRTDAAREAFRLAAGELLERRREGDGPPELDPADASIVGSAKIGARAVRVREGGMRILHPGSEFQVACAFSPDGRLLAAAGRKGLRVWLAASGSERWTAWTDAEVESVAFSPDGARLLAGLARPRARLVLRDAASREVVWEAAGGRSRAPASDVAYGPRGDVVVASLSDGGVVLRDAASGALRWERSARDRGLDYATDTQGVCFVGEAVAVAYSDGLVGFWRVADGAYAEELHGGGAVLTDVAPVPPPAFGGAFLATADQDGRAAVWRALPDGLAAPTDLLEGRGARVNDLSVSAGGDRLAAACDDGSLWVLGWNAALGEPAPAQRFRVESQRLQSCDLAPGGEAVAATGEWGVRVWEVAARRTAAAHAPIALGPGQRLVGAVLGSLQSFASFDRSGQPEGPPRRVTDYTGARRVEPRGFAFLGPDRVVASVSDASDRRGGRLEVWSLGARGGGPGQVWPCARPGVVTATPDGELVACGAWTEVEPDRGDVSLFEAATGRVRARLEHHVRTVTAVAFGPRGERLASADVEGRVAVWALGAPDAPVFGIAAGARDGPRGYPAGPPQPETDTRGGAVHDVAFSPGGDLLALALASGDVLLWTIGEPAPAARVEAHEGAVLACGFLADGEALVTASRDGTVRTWDATARPPSLLLTTETRGARGIEAAALGPERRALAVTIKGHARVELLPVDLPPYRGDFRADALAAARAR